MPRVLMLCAALWSAYFVLLPAARAEPFAVGLVTLQIADPHGLRPLTVRVLYPAEAAGAAQTVGETAAQKGFSVRPDAPKAPGHFPLLLVSHGLYGKWSNYGWLAAALAAKGMIVALPTHPGTAWVNKDSPETARLWQRPKDLSRVITHMTLAPDWRTAVDPDHIAAFGHSMGGFTVMAAAGARFDTARYERYCKAHPDRGDCRWYAAAAVERAPDAQVRLQEPARDPRLRAVVSYDLGFTQAFDPASVGAIAIPVLVIGAGNHQAALPVAAESRRLAALLPAATSRYYEIADISHFSIFPECKAGATALLAALGQGDEVICIDGAPGSGGRDRATLHSLLLRMVTDFLADAGFPVQ